MYLGRETPEYYFNHCGDIAAKCYYFPLVPFSYILNTLEGREFICLRRFLSSLATNDIVLLFQLCSKLMLMCNYCCSRGLLLSQRFYMFRVAQTVVSFHSFEYQVSISTRDANYYWLAFLCFHCCSKVLRCLSNRQ